MELLLLVWRQYRWPFISVIALSLLSAALGIGLIAFINLRLMTVVDTSLAVLPDLATNIPAAIEIDVTALGIGDSIAAKDLNLPEGAVFPGEPDDLMLSVTAAKTQEQIDAELDAAVAGDEGEAPAEAEAEAAESE